MRMKVSGDNGEIRPVRFPLDYSDSIFNSEHGDFLDYIPMSFAGQSAQLVEFHDNSEDDDEGQVSNVESAEANESENPQENNAIESSLKRKRKDSDERSAS